MNHPPLPPSPGLPRSRRNALRQLARGGVAVASAAWLGTGCAPRVVTRPKVKVGLLHSQTGTMAISETSLRDAELFAIEEINAAGGVLGRLIEPVVEDPRSRFDDLFPKRARKLLVRDEVAAVFGCWTSSSRKAVLPVFEELNGLLFYPVQYEGAECSRHIVYTGSVPNQQILPAIDWMRSLSGGSKRRFFLIGSDYVFPRTANYIISRHLQATYPDTEIVGAQYVPFGHKDFDGVLRAMRASEADAVINTLNGDSNIAFYNALAAAGVRADTLPVLATSIGEDELRGLLPQAVSGHLAAWHYFQSVDTPANRDFVQRFHHEHGEDRVLGDPMEAAYVSVYLWKLAVETADSFETDAVRHAFLQRLEVAGPGGTVWLDPKTQHLHRFCRIGRIRPDRQFDIVWQAPRMLAPDPFPQDAFPGWRCDWTADGLTRGQPVALDL